ncbi:MAG TPA: ABC-type transport auxiliary lipoprotein family protein [Rhodanobacteraceae bacterium]|jgi:cholesterol transport system auxiliary component|nr:ABC-type transport auxiliary lipoprotein family protein [Rhodanobacteraceae bacterium]
MIRMRRWLLPCAAGLALGACSSLTGKKEPFTVYAPRYTAPADAAKGASVQWQLSIDTPVASDALDTPRMLVMPTPGALETYKGARWSDTAPMLLRALLVQAFQESGRISGVGASTSGLHGDYLLAIDLYDFETQYRDGSPHAVIRLNAKVTDSSLNRIAAAHTFEADIPVAGSQAAAAASAFEQAFAQMLPTIVDWTLTEGQSRWEKNAPQREAR